MLVEHPRCRFYKKLYFIITLLLMVSSVIGRAFSLLNSIAIIALLITWLSEGALRLKIAGVLRQPLFLILLAFYLCYLSGLFHSENSNQSLFVAQRELPLLIIPLVLLSKPRFSTAELASIYTYFISAAFIWMLAATIIAANSYFHTGESGVFFYHQFVAPIGSTAIYSSMVCILVLIVLEKTNLTATWKYVFYGAFTGWLLLLSSKMFLLIYLVLLLIYIFYHIVRRYRLLTALTCLSVFIGLCLASKPLQRRFVDLAHFKSAYLTEATFNPQLYFDGLSLRLVYIRFSLEILQEQGSFLLGVGTGDSGDLLKDKIRQYHMYTGQGLHSNGGYLRYSFHNVYLETLVSMGLFGLAINLLFLGYILYEGIRRKKPLILSLAVVMSLSSLTDVIVLNSQFDVTMLMVILCTALSPPVDTKQQMDSKGTRAANQTILE